MTRRARPTLPRRAAARLASPELLGAIESVLAGAREAGRLAGVFAGSPTDAARWRSAGVGLVVLGSDLS
jgi:2-keto-3-deoxy-L-rhamnonate aldolase RhmA